MGTMTLFAQAGYETVAGGATIKVMTPSIEIALWILIGLLGVCALATIIFLVPNLVQMNKVLKEAEKSLKRLNEEILPPIEQIVKETAPTVTIVMSRIHQTAQSMDSIIGGIQAISAYMPFLFRSKIGKTLGVMSKIAQGLAGMGKKYREKEAKGGSNE